jgi:hypothetical protein
MTRRKDPQPEADVPQDVPPAEPVAAEPFVMTDPVDPPPPPEVDPPLPPETVDTARSPESDPPQPPVVVRRGNFVAPLLGGALAAVGGFALAHFDALGLRPADTTAEVAALSAQLAELQQKTADLDRIGGELAAMSDRVAQLEAAPAPAAPDLSLLDDFDARLAAIEAIPQDGGASTAALTAKLAELERRLASQPQGPSPELQQQIDAALARLDEAEAAAAARASEAEAATAAAGRAAALDVLADKVGAGEPFGPDLEAVGDAALTEALAALADTGVPTLGQLQATFPDAARDALRVAREANTDDGWGGRFLDFLAAQTGARPLTPLEGDTPDAILSRADFALSEGRVADAVAELETLDPALGATLDPWLTQARAYLAATAALQTARGE